MAASYPGAVKTFATRSAGQSIDPGHVNDLQDEVSAIESGLLNGTAPLVASNATLNGLQVTGTSTFTGDVVFTGTVSGIGTATPPTVKVNNSADQQMSSGTWTGLSWDTEEYDSTGMHSTASNSSRLTFAGSTGIYNVGFSIESQNNVINARIMRNDSAVICKVVQTGQGPIAASVDLRAADVTDYVTLQVFATNSTGRILAQSTGVACVFWSHRVSA